MQQQHENVELHIAGLFTDGAKCQKEIGRLHLKGVTAYGRVDKERIRQILYASDALVLPSRSEVQPLVLLEAMSTGIPVISTECIPRCIRIEKGCTIVPIGDVPALAKAMLSVLSAPDVDMQGVSNEVRALASPEVVGKRLEELFREQL